MTIPIVWGSASANTELGALDRALAGAGLHNYNLVELSSVLPAGATIDRVGRLPADRWATGERVTVVAATATSGTPGDRLAAGLGWATAPDGGVFMEATATTLTSCRAQLQAMIADARATRDWDWETPFDAEVRATDVEGAGAVVVAAVFDPLAGGSHPE